MGNTLFLYQVLLQADDTGFKISSNEKFILPFLCLFGV